MELHHLFISSFSLGMMKDRKYSFREVSVILLSMLAVVLLLGSEGLYNWAYGFEINKKRDVAIAVTEPVYNFTKMLNLTAPKKFVENTFNDLRGVKRAAGFVDAMEDTTVIDTTETVVDTVEKPVKFRDGTELQILLIGDSMMGKGLGSAIDKYFTRDTLFKVKRYSMHSSGLTRPDYFDWFKQAKSLVGEKHYNIVIMSFGANDAQAAIIDGKRQRFGNAKWMEKYEEKIRKLLTILESSVDVVYYIGLPPMRPKGYDGRMEKLSGAYKKIFNEHTNMYYLPTHSVVGDTSKAYTSFMTIDGKRKRIRVGDGIHFTPDGGTLVAKALYKHIKENLVEPVDLNFNTIQIKDLEEVK